MTTATQDPKAEGAFSERELQKQEATLRETREKLSEMREREAEIEFEIADALEAGEDPEKLRAEREEIRAFVSDLAPVVPILAQRIRERRRRKLVADAEERLRGIKKRVGGIVGEAPRRAAKAQDLSEELARQLEWLLNAHLRRRLLQEEARGLAAAFDLEVPELREFEDRPEEVARSARRIVRAPSAPRDSLALGLDVTKAVGLLERMYGEGTPTPEILEALKDLDGEEQEAGPTPHQRRSP